MNNQSLVLMGMNNVLVTKKKSCIIFKVDFEKAYDLVSWSFLYYMMKRLGFREQHIDWIKDCLQSVSIFILVNGSLTTKFTT